MLSSEIKAELLLMIDNYDSFIYNVVQYVGEFYPDIKVFRNDAITLEEALAMAPAGIIISPGPGRPEDSKVSLDLIKNPAGIPVLGVCLGHQGIALAHGAEVIGAKTIMHGKSSVMKHTADGIFEGVSNPFSAIRYHSLVAKRENLPDVLEITAESDDGEIMGLKVKGKDIYGVQFHPESILTQEGKTILKNFVNIVQKKQQITQSERMTTRIKSILGQITERKNLTQEDAREMMEIIMRGHATPSQIGAYLMAIRMKGETADEIAGSVLAMMEVCLKVQTNMEPLVDTCGSGGDQSDTFNISTASAFVTAGAGCYVAKHGNRSITSMCGSSDVLAKLGVNIQCTPSEVVNCIEKGHIGFMFAPFYHPAMKYVMPTRREIGVRTLFNILGPVSNPAGVKHHVMGVFSKELLELVPEVFVKLGHKHSLVIHGEGGLDEATIEGKTFVREIKDGAISSWEIDPKEYDLDGKLSSLKVKTAEESSAIITSVLKGENRGDARKAVVLNAGLAIFIAKNIPLKQAIRQAEQSIDTGKALEAMENLIRLSNGKA